MSFALKNIKNFTINFIEFAPPAEGGGKLKAVLWGGGAALGGAVAALTAPLWGPTAAAGAGVVLVGAAAVGAGTKVATYGYNTPRSEFKDVNCLTESIKGAGQGALSGAFVAGGTLVAPLVGPAIAPAVLVASSGLGSACSEAANEFCEGEKIDSRKILVAGTVGAVGAGVGLVADKIASCIPMNSIIATAAKGASIGGAAATVCTLTENALMNTIQEEKRDVTDGLVTNVALGMGIGAVSQVSQAKANESLKAKISSLEQQVNAQKEALTEVRKTVITKVKVRKKGVFHRSIPFQNTDAVKAKTDLAQSTQNLSSKKATLQQVVTSQTSLSSTVRSVSVNSILPQLPQNLSSSVTSTAPQRSPNSVTPSRPQQSQNSNPSATQSPLHRPQDSSYQEQSEFLDPDNEPRIEWEDLNSDSHTDAFPEKPPVVDSSTAFFPLLGDIEPKLETLLAPGLTADQLYDFHASNIEPESDEEKKFTKEVLTYVSQREISEENISNLFEIIYFLHNQAHRRCLITFLKSLTEEQMNTLTDGNEKASRYIKQNQNILKSNVTTSRSAVPANISTPPAISMGSASVSTLPDYRVIHESHENNDENISRRQIRADKRKERSARKKNLKNEIKIAAKEQDIERIFWSQIC